MKHKIGFACKWIDSITQIDGIDKNDSAKLYSTRTTTITWLNNQSKHAAETRLWELMIHNVNSIRHLIQKVGSLPTVQHMVRLSSDILPAYSHHQWSYFYKLPDVLRYLESELIKVGDIARALDVKLSFHPGQFVVLASENPGIVQNSITEFEYHADLARMMGYGRKFQDYKINVHISGKQGPEGIRKVYSKLSVEARNCLTLENEENSWGLDDCLSLMDIVPTVLDIHHYWIREGSYIQPDDYRIQMIKDSWKDIRPTMHYSVSREDILVDHCSNTLPDHITLMLKYKKQKLRAHSDFYWNHAVNDYALEFTDNFDIMCESKAKNLASTLLCSQI